MKNIKYVALSFCILLVVVLLYQGIPVGVVDKRVTVLNSGVEQLPLGRGIGQTFYYVNLEMDGGKRVKFTSLKPIPLGDKLVIQKYFSVLKLGYVYELDQID